MSYFAFGILLVLLFIVSYFVWRFLQKPKTVESMNLDDCRRQTIDDVEINYYQQGKGQDLLLIHGHGASAYCWSDIYSQLAKDYKVTALDLPGFGLSSKNPDLDYGYSSQIHRVEKFCEALGIEDAFVVGCSMGGMLALGMAIDFPHRVKSLAVISPAVSPSLTAVAPKRALWLVKNFGTYIARPYLVEKMATRVFMNKEKLAPKYLEHYYSTYHNSPDAVICFWKALDTLREFPHYKSLGKIKQNILLLFGEQDKVTPWRTMRRLIQQVPQLKIIKHPHGGHHLMEDEPDFVTEKLQSFFGSP